MLRKLLSDSTRRGGDKFTVGRTVGVGVVDDGVSGLVSNEAGEGVGSTAVLLDVPSVFSSGF